MSCDLEPADLSKHDEEEEGEEEDEELMFAFEPQSDDENSMRSKHEGTKIFYSINGVSIERPVNPIVAILEHQEAAKSTKASREEDIVKLEDKVAVPSVLPSRKRKTDELPTNTCAQTFHPIAKRAKSNASERSVTATACLMDNLSLHRSPEGQCQRQQEETTSQDNEHKKDIAPVRSASMSIPNRFQPIHWPGDASGACSVEKDCSHSCSSLSSPSSSCSSSKPRIPSSLSHSCRIGADVLSPTHVHFNDLVVHSSAGSYTGS